MVLAAMCLLPLLATSETPHAQTVSITSVTPNAPNIGRVVSAARRATVFRIAPTGLVSLASGSGVRMTGGNASIAAVTLRCSGGSNATCPNTNVTIQAAGTPTGRALPLTTFTVAGGVNPPLMTAAKGKNSISFTVTGALRNSTYDFYVGMDFGIEGDDSPKPTGAATSSYSVSVPGSAYTGTASADVFRPISVTQSSPLDFGIIVRPRSGSSIVSMSPVTGALSVTGSAAIFPVRPATRASFVVTGEGGQTFSISVPPFTLTSKGQSLTVTPSSDPSGSAGLAGFTGSGTSQAVYVGGSFILTDATSPGTYTGSVTIAVQYN